MEEPSSIASVVEKIENLILVAAPDIGSVSTFADDLGLKPGRSPLLGHYSYTIDTKYYTAEVDVLCLQPTQLSLLPNELSPECLICFATESDSASSVEEWTAVVAERFRQSEIQMLVAYADNGHSHSGSVYLKRSMEIIEVIPGSKPSDQRGLLRDTDGIDRVVEALQSHMWPLRRSKTPPRRGRPTVKEKVYPEIERDDKYEEGAGTGTLSSAGNDVGDPLESSLEGMDLPEIDDMNALLGQVRAFRENTHAMSDADRREGAAQLAIKMAMALGLDDDVSSSDSDEN